MVHPLLTDIEGWRAEVDVVRHDLQQEVNAGCEWLRPFLRRLVQWEDDLQNAATEHLRSES